MINTLSEEQQREFASNKLLFYDKYNSLYRSAILHIAWRIDTIENKPYRRLVVAWIEFFPFECTYDCALPECKKYGFFYIKIKMKIEEAVQWYFDVLKNKYITMTWQKDEKIFFNSQDSSSVILYNNPAYPKMTVSDNVPYSGRNWGVAQHNHIFPEQIDADMLEAINTPKHSSWLEDRLFWNINEHLEYLGSVNLLFPNPIYSKLSCRLLPQKNENSKDGDEVCCKVTLRKGQSPQAMKFVFAERTMGEIYDLTEMPISQDVFKVNVQTYAEENAKCVIHSNLGVIDYQSFSFFLRSIETNIRVGGAERKAILQSGEEYTTKVYTDVSTIKAINKQLSENNFRNRLNIIRYGRSQQEAGDKLRQKIFFDEHGDATNLIREIIGNATKKIIIIDPYFGVLETYRFVLAASSTNIEVEIITSGDLLREVDAESLFAATGNTLQEAKDARLNTQEHEVGNVLKRHVDSIKQKDKSFKNIDVNVMIGKAIFHDRFIIIDDTDVWFSGNSFNSIGKKVGAIIKLPNPNEMFKIIKTLHTGQDSLMSLNEWIERRKENKEK